MALHEGSWLVFHHFYQRFYQLYLSPFYHIWTLVLYIDLRPNALLIVWNHLWSIFSNGWRLLSLLLQVSPQSQRRARASVSDVSTVRDIESLSVRQLKEILARNFVNYSGCCEKWELVERVCRLYREREKNRKSCGYYHTFHTHLRQLRWIDVCNLRHLALIRAVVVFSFMSLNLS